MSDTRPHSAESDGSYYPKCRHCGRWIVRTVVQTRWGAKEEWKHAV